MNTRTRLVLAVTPDRVALALAVKDAVIREDVRQRDAEESLEAVTRALVDRIVATNSGRTSIDFLLCKPLASRKPLFGVPSSAGVDDVRSRLKECPQAFFLGDEGTIVTGDPVPLGDEWWASAVDRATLEALMRACDGVAIDSCRVIAIDRPSAPEDLVVAARAAASRSVVDPLSLDPLASVRRARGQRRRLRLLSAALVVGLTASALGPAALHAMFAQREGRDLDALQGTVNSTHAWARSVAAQRLDDEARLARLDGRAPLRTPLVGSLGRALPEAAIVISLAVDSTAGSVVVLAPPGVDVLRAVSSVKSIADAQLSGAVTRERLLERDMNRTTVSFRVETVGAPR